MSSTTTCSRLRHRLTLQQETQTPDGAGGYVRSWVNIVDLWAEIVTLGGKGAGTRGGGKEALVAGQIQGDASHRILLRYRDGVTPDMRLVFENRVFNIRSVTDDGEDRNTLSLLVQEGAGG